MTYFIDYNGKFIKSYKTIKACINYINKKNLQDDLDNTLRIVDEKGDEYHITLGYKL